MIKATVSGELKFPKFTFQKDLQYIGERIIVPIMQKNIEDQVAIDGSLLPINEDKTLKRKAAAGQGSKSLIATGRLINAFTVRAFGQTQVKISLNSDRKSIGGYLQTGIKTNEGTKKYKFFGINVQMEKNAVAYMKQKIKDAINAVKR